MPEIVITQLETPKLETDKRYPYHAQIKDRPELWAAGNSYHSVIGNLVATHREEFGVTDIMVLDNKGEVIWTSKPVIDKELDFNIISLIENPDFLEIL